MFVIVFFFFFQAEDGIRDLTVTGVQTCALPICPLRSLDLSAGYTWLDTSILALDGSTLVSSPFEVGQPLLRRPRSSASYNITWRHRRLTLNTNAFIRRATLDLEPNFAASTFRNPGYALANAGFSYP